MNNGLIKGITHTVKEDTTEGEYYLGNWTVLMVGHSGLE